MGCAILIDKFKQKIQLHYRRQWRNRFDVAIILLWHEFIDADIFDIEYSYLQFYWSHWWAESRSAQSYCKFEEIIFYRLTEQPTKIHLGLKRLCFTIDQQKGSFIDIKPIPRRLFIMHKLNKQISLKEKWNSWGNKIMPSEQIMLDIRATDNKIRRVRKFTCIT